jgi:hypothetical protein
MMRTILGLTLSTAIGLFAGCDAMVTGNITAEQYSAIEMGMTEDEVREVAGEPAGEQEVNVGTALHPQMGVIWYYNNADVGITFRGGKVISKAEEGLGVGSEGEGWTY